MECDSRIVVRSNRSHCRTLSLDPRFAMSASPSASNRLPSNSTGDFTSDSRLGAEDSAKREIPSREELIGILESLADHFRYENINIRLVLTALAAAIHTGDERELSRHVAAFDATRRTRAVQDRLLQDAMRIIRGR